MNELERIRWAFRLWFMHYKAEDWRNLTEEEKELLEDFHCNNFIDELGKITQEGDYPFNNETK